MTFLETQRIVRTLSQTCKSHVVCAARRSARVCVRWGVICTRTVAFMAVATVWTRNCQKESLRSAQDYTWIPHSSELFNNWTMFARRQVVGLTFSNWEDDPFVYFSRLMLEFSCHRPWFQDEDAHVTGERRWNWWNVNIQVARILTWTYVIGSRWWKSALIAVDFKFVGDMTMILEPRYVWTTYGHSGRACIFWRVRSHWFGPHVFNMRMTKKTSDRFWRDVWSQGGTKKRWTSEFLCYGPHSVPCRRDRPERFG